MARPMTDPDHADRTTPGSDWAARPLEGPARLRPELPRRVELGHVHLMVADIDRSLRLYSDTLGFELTARLGDEAAFVSTGGYHHTIGMNTWYSRDCPRPPDDAAGLVSLRLAVADRALAAALTDRARRLGLETEEGPDHFTIEGPDGEHVELAWRSDEAEGGAAAGGGADTGGASAGGTPPRIDPGAELVNVTLRATAPRGSLRRWAPLGFDPAPASGEAGESREFGEPREFGQAGESREFGEVGGSREANSGEPASGSAAGTALSLRSGDQVPQLTFVPGASRPQPQARTGLFHVALRYRTLQNLIEAVGRARAAGLRPTGASDHGFNLAVYFRDPDGLGLELYWNLDRADWPPPAPGARIAIMNEPLRHGPLRAALA
jgi:catechol 2,3-dioxygenase